MKKILSITLAAVMLLSLVPTAFAADNNWQSGTEVVYTAETSESYTVTVPAQLAPGGSGDVVAEGTWGSDRKLVVTADETVTLANSINANDAKTLDIGFAGIELAGSNTTAVSDTKAVSVADIENALFGTWTGTFYYNVEMVDAVEMISFGIQAYTQRNPDTDRWVLGEIVTFQAEKGMTWAEWCDSEYNVPFDWGFGLGVSTTYIYTDGWVCREGDDDKNLYKGSEYNGPEKGTDIIEANVIYRVIDNH